MSGLFKSKKTELPAPKTITTPQQQKSYDYFQKFIDEGGRKYTGQMTAEPQKYEGYLPGLVESYANRSETPLYSSAKSQLQSTLNDNYDPYNSQYYKAYRDQSMANLEEAQNLARQSANVGGMLRSSGRLNTENKLIGSTTRDLNSILAGMYEKERMNKLAAVDPAFQMSQYEEGAPLRTAEAVMGVGGYQTQQKQAGLDRLYQDYLNSIGMEQNAAQTLANPGTYNYYQPTYSTQPSIFDKYIFPLVEAGVYGASGAAAGGSGKGTKKPAAKKA